MKKIAALFLFLSLIMFCTCEVFAETLVLPPMLTTIKEEAFMGDTSLDIVVLPDGLRTINSRAFSDSSIKMINLPSSISFIADDAFYGTDKVEFISEKDTYARNWLIENGYIVDTSEYKLSFIMKQNDKPVNKVMVGTEVEFEVSAPENVSFVQLIVDDVEYETYDITSGSFKRVFHSAAEGIRLVQLKTLTSDGECLTSEVKTLNVNAKGTLDEPNFTVTSSTMKIGDPVTITIQPTDFSDNWYIWIYAADSSAVMLQLTRTREMLEESNGMITLDGSWFQTSGTYRVYMIVTGEGYSQNEKSEMITLNDDSSYYIDLVSPNNGDYRIPGETISIAINQTGGGYAAVKVTCPLSGIKWYPEDGTVLTNAETYSVEIPVEESGDYMIQGFVFAANISASGNENLSQNRTEKIIVHSKGPAFIQSPYFVNNDSYNTWIEYEEKTLVVITNDSVDEITVRDLISSETYVIDDYNEPPNSYQRTFIVPFPDDTEDNSVCGYHKITVIGKNKTTNKTTNVWEKEFYIAKKVSPYIVFAEKQMRLKSSPINGSDRNIVQGGETFEPLTVIRKAGDWLFVKRNISSATNRAASNKDEGFLPAADLDINVPANASGRVTIVYPTDGCIMPVGDDNLVEIEWTSGVAFPIGDNARILLYVTDPVTQESHTLQGTGLFKTTFDISEIELNTEYQIELQISLNVISDPVNVVFGEYIPEDIYKQWYRTVILPAYLQYIADRPAGLLVGNSYKYEFQKLSLAADMIVKGDILYHQGIIKNWYEKSEYACMEPDDIFQLNLMSISDIVKSDEAKIEEDLGVNINNVKESIHVSQNNAVVQAQVDLACDSLEALAEGLETWMKVTELNTAGLNDIAPEQESFLETFVTLLIETLWKIVRETIEGIVKDYNTEALIEAYKEEYANALRNTCDYYINYLETAIFGENGVYENNEYLTSRELAAKEFIIAFNTYKSDDGRRKEDAVKALLIAVGETSETSLISDDQNLMDYIINAFMQKEIWTEFANDMLDELIKVVVEKKGGSVNDEKLIRNIKDLLKALIWDDENFWFKAPDVPAFINKAAECGLEASAGELLGLIASGFSEGVFAQRVNRDYTSRNLKPEEGVYSDHEKVQNGIIAAAMDLAEQAWETGEEFADVINDVVELSVESKDFTVFQKYASLMANAINYRLTFLMSSGGNFTNLYIDQYSISELEKQRAAFISLMNNDIMAYIYLGNMREVNKNAQGQFILRYGNGQNTFGLEDYIPKTTQNWAIAEINNYKSILTNVPSSIKRILGNY